MTYRELIGFTPNMGIFEVAAVWSAVPQIVKDKLPQQVKDAIDILCTAVGAYSAAVNIYNIAQQALDLVKEAQVSASLPPNPSVAIGIAAKEAAKLAIQQAVSGLNSSFSPIDFALDQQIPA